MTHAKAIYAAVTTLLTGTITALTTVNPHHLSAIEETTWLTILLSTITVAGGVYQITNKPSN